MFMGWKAPYLEDITSPNIDLQIYHKLSQHIRRVFWKKLIAISEFLYRNEKENWQNNLEKNRTVKKTSKHWFQDLL